MILLFQSGPNNFIGGKGGGPWRLGLGVKTNLCESRSGRIQDSVSSPVSQNLIALTNVSEMLQKFNLSVVNLILSKQKVLKNWKND